MKFELISGSSNKELCSLVAQKLDVKPIIPEIIRFADGEIEVTFPDFAQIKGKKAFIVQSTCPPVHENLMELLINLFQAKNAGANDLIAVVPYFGYARHDKNKIQGAQGSAALIARLIENAGAQKIITVALHSQITKSYFTHEIINIDLIDFIAAHIKNQFSDLAQICLVAPDKGAQERVKAIAQQLGVGHIFFSKQRVAIDKSEIVASQTDCKGKIAIIVDDMIDTGGTAINACDALVARGFNQIYGYFIHPVLSGNAAQIIEHSKFTQIFVSNSIPLKSAGNKITVFDISEVLVKYLND